MSNFHVWYKFHKKKREPVKSSQAWINIPDKKKKNYKSLKFIKYLNQFFLRNVIGILNDSSCEQSIILIAFTEIFFRGCIRVLIGSWNGKDEWFLGVSIKNHSDTFRVLIIVLLLYNQNLLLMFTLKKINVNKNGIIFKMSEARKLNIKKNKIYVFKNRCIIWRVSDSWLRYSAGCGHLACRAPRAAILQIRSFLCIFLLWLTILKSRVYTSFLFEKKFKKNYLKETFYYPETDGNVLESSHIKKFGKIKKP